MSQPSHATQRMACVDIPALPLQLLLRRHPDWRQHPAAVIDRDKAQGEILWVNNAARRLRILPGMRYCAGLSLSSELRAGVVEAAEIDDSSQQLADQFRLYTADVEAADEAGVFWLDANGLSLLYPSLERWASLLHAELLKDGWFCGVVVGFSRFGSYALAKSSTHMLALKTQLQEEQLARTVRLDRLGLAPKTRERLAKLGIHDLGGFLDLPSDGIRRRFGADIHRLHQLGRGELWAPLVPQTAQEPICVRQLLDQPERNLDRMMYLVEEFLCSLIDQLRSRHQLLLSLRLALKLDRGDERVEELRPAHPTLELKSLLELIRLRLAAHGLASGVHEIALELFGTSPAKGQLELFPDTPGRDLVAAERAFARLRAELGEDAVLRATLSHGHLPEAGFNFERFDTLQAARPRSVHHRPLVRRILPKPMALSHQRRDEPDGWMILGLEGGPVQDVRGPYVVSGGWWMREISREYHFVRTPNTGWLWVYFDRRRRRWYLQGAVE